MTDTEKSLLDAVCADPFDDLPRWVAADWYDDNGQGERAEFVRSSINGVWAEEDHTDDEPLKGGKWLTREQRLQGRILDGLHLIGWEEDGRVVYIREKDRPLVSSATRIDIAFSRGFPDSVTLSLSQLMGGPCLCNGPYIYSVARAELYGCPSCHGTGAIPGLVDVLGRWPLRECRVTGVEPFNYEGSRWGWFREVSQSRSSTIPAEIWKLMSPQILYSAVPYMVKWYPTPELSHDALNRAALDLIRERAGLRPFPHTDPASPAASEARRASSVVRA